MKKESFSEAVLFTSAEHWEDWLEKHHETALGVWLQIYKKNSGKKSVTYDEALDAALCYGWIDSQMKGLDAESYIQKFGPRRAKSTWSALNRKHVARLIKEGRMKPAGLEQVRLAKKEGRWT